MVPRKTFIDIKYLWLEQILEVRANWHSYTIYSIVLPIILIFGFTRLGSGLTDNRSLLYIISGAAIFTSVNNGIYVMAMRIGTMKQDGMLLYYASLPISKTSFVLAVILSRLLITLPGMIIPIFWGAWFYEITFSFSLWIFVILILSALSLSAIGMAIGSYIDNLELISVFVNATNFITALIAPVFIPSENLPPLLRIVGYFLPPTYAAATLRDSLLNNITTAFYINLTILFIMTLFSFFVINKWMKWKL